MLSKDLCHQLDKNTKPGKKNFINLMVNFQIKVHLSAQIDSENYFRVSTLSKADLFSSHNKLVFL